MKIAICSKENNEKSLLSNRFARTPFFMLFDTSTNSYVSIKNEAINESGGAGAKAVKILGDLDVAVVLCPEVGPKAMEALDGFGIRPYDFSKASTVDDALNLFIEDQLPEIKTSHLNQYK